MAFSGHNHFSNAKLLGITSTGENKFDGDLIPLKDNEFSIGDEINSLGWKGLFISPGSKVCFGNSTYCAFLDSNFPTLQWGGVNITKTVFDADLDILTWTVNDISRLRLGDTGLIFDPTDSNQSPLSNFQEFLFANADYSDSGGASNYQDSGQDVTGDICITQIGPIVHLHFQGITGTMTLNSVLAPNMVIPVRFRPSAQTQTAFIINEDGVSGIKQIGVCQIDTNGLIAIGTNGLTDFDSSSTDIGFSSGVATYSTASF